MAEYLVQDTDLTAVADAIRTKTGSSDSIAFPDGFVSAVEGISTSEVVERTAWYRPPDWPDYDSLIADKSIFEDDYVNQTTIHCFYTIDTKIPNMTSLTPKYAAGTFEIGHFENGDFVADETISFPYDLTQHEERFVILRQVGTEFGFTNKAVPDRPLNPIIEIYGRLNGINLSGMYKINPQRLPTVRAVTLFGTVNFGSLAYAMIPMWAEYIDLSHATIPDVSSRMYGENAFKGCINLHTLLFPTSRQIATTDQFSLQHSRFANCYNLTNLDVSMWDVTEITSLGSTFDSDVSLVTLDISNWNMSSCTTTSNMFRYCYSLTNLITDGVTLPSIAISFSDCTALSVDSLNGIIAALPTLEDGTSLTLTLGSTNTAKLTEAEIAVATEKGWTVA